MDFNVQRSFFSMRLLTEETVTKQFYKNIKTLNKLYNLYLNLYLTLMGNAEAIVARKNLHEMIMKDSSHKTWKLVSLSNQLLFSS